jgi:hypothetical protein
MGHAGTLTSKMQGAQELLGAIRMRETQLMESLFRGGQSLPQVGRRSPKGARLR